LDAEARWLRETWRPGERQLTWRAAAAGVALGALLSLSNLYVVLKTGWSLGVTITACVLAWAGFGLLRRVRLSRRPFGALENNAMASVASSAGYMTGGGNMAAAGALLMLTGARPEGPWLVLWFAAIAALGVFVAVPIKRQLVNLEALPFPTGTATAVTIRALHEREGPGRSQARWLAGAALLGGAIALAKDLHAPWMPFRLPEAVGLPFLVAGLPAARWTISLETSVLMLGGGALMGFRTCWSMLLAALASFGLLAPWLVGQGIIAGPGYKAIVGWTLWGAAGILVSSGLVSFAWQWRSVARSFRELGALVRPSRAAADDPLAAVECPAWWFPAGFLVLGPVLVVLMDRLFGIPWWAGALTLPLALAMGVVAARVTGETDVTPTKALGPVTQLVYGGLLPANVTANVMGANATGGVGLHAADLLTNLKTGWLLGASARQQFWAQILGCLVGAVAVVPAFALLVPEASVLGSEAFPAPASQVWAGVSQVLSAGAAALHPTARVAALLGLGLGGALAAAEKLLPARLVRFLPSPSGLGIAMMIPAHNSIAMFLGSLCALALQRRSPALAEATVVPVASGFIAGESLVGIAVAMLVAGGWGR